MIPTQLLPLLFLTFILPYLYFNNSLTLYIIKASAARLNY